MGPVNINGHIESRRPQRDVAVDISEIHQKVAEGSGSIVAHYTLNYVSGELHAPHTGGECLFIVAEMPEGYERPSS